MVAPDLVRELVTEAVEVAVLSDTTTEASIDSAAGETDPAVAIATSDDATSAANKPRQSGGPESPRASPRRRLAAWPVPALQRATQPVDPCLGPREGRLPGLRHVRTRRRAARPDHVRPIPGSQVRLRGRMAWTQRSPGSLSRLLDLSQLPEHPASLKPHERVRAEQAQEVTFPGWPGRGGRCPAAPPAGEPAGRSPAAGRPVRNRARTGPSTRGHSRPGVGAPGTNRR